MRNQELRGQLTDRVFDAETLLITDSLDRQAPGTDRVPIQVRRPRVGARFRDLEQIVQRRHRVPGCCCERAPILEQVPVLVELHQLPIINKALNVVLHRRLLHLVVNCRTSHARRLGVARQATYRLTSVPT